MHVDMSKYYKPSTHVKVVYNLGFPFDCMSGGYVKGIHGENISQGGLWPTTGIAGPGNVNKTTVSRHMSLTVLARYVQAQCASYDTESSASPSRWYQLAQRFEELCGLDLIEEARLYLSDCTQMYGNEWFENFKKLVADKVKDKKALTLMTPYADQEGKPIPAMIPSIMECDSISMFVVEATQEMVDKAELGESGRNVVPMKSAGAKSQMLMEIPTMTAHGACPTISIAVINSKAIPIYRLSTLRRPVTKP